MAVIRVPTCQIKLFYNDWVKIAGVQNEVKKKKEIFIPQDVLISMQQNLTITDRGNACSITFLDPDFKIANLLRERAIKNGGIDIPENLLGEESDPTNNPGKASSGTFTTPKAGTKGDELAKSILQYCNSVGVNNKNHQAAILANIQAETLMGVYSKEVGGESARYAPYFGRGLIQLTWKSNYVRFGKFYGQDFVNNPDLVSDYKYAIPIAVGGMTGIKGHPTFTAYKLLDFDKPNGGFDFVNARRTVNGLDKADQIATDAKNWLGKLATLLTDGIRQATIQEGGFAPAALVPEGVSDAISTVKKAVQVYNFAEKSIEIEIERGWTDREDTYFTNFWYVSHSISSSVPPYTTITGRGIRFLMQQGSRSRIVQKNFSLRQLAQRIGTKYGVDTVIPNTPASESIASKTPQNGEDDYKLLQMMASSLGFVLVSSTNPPTLKLQQIKVGNRRKVSIDWGATFSTSESADNQRILKELPPIDKLVDGQSIGEGFTATLEMKYPPIDALRIQPGNILEIPVGTIEGFSRSKAFCREYVVKKISDSWGQGENKIVLDLYIPVNIKAPLEQDSTGSGKQTTAATGNNAAILASAKKWVGRDFNLGATEQCMAWVRSVLTDAKHPKANFITKQPYDGLSTGINLASSLSGGDCGLQITNAAQLQPGDILCFGGTYGGYPLSTITHVGIVSGNGIMIDRSTKSAPVRERSIEGTFPGKFRVAVRLSV